MLDLIICVYACDTIDRYKQQIIKMNEKYKEVLNEYKNIKLIYFLGEEKTDLIGEQYINLKNVRNDYLSASYKQNLGLKYIYENYKTKFIMCIGTDAYVNIKKLNLFLKNFDENENLYIGGHGDNREIGKDNIYFHSGGPGFILSYKCLDLIYNYLGDFVEEWSQICRKYDLKYLYPACDVAISYLIQKKTDNLKIIIIPGLVFTNCNYLGYPCHKNQINYTDLISCHNMSLEDFDNFYTILSNNNYFI